jgi:hypothetical protein
MLKKLFLLFVITLNLPLNALNVAENKKAQCLIAVSANQTEFEKMAAVELKNFLGKVTGADFKIVKESEVAGKPAIYLGQTRYAQNNGIDYSKADKEEWILKNVGKNLVISGGRPVGTLYGVYGLLEKLGVYFPTKDCTVIPQKNKLKLSGLNERKKPAFAGRNVFDGFSWPAFVTKVPASVHKAHWLYRLRNRLNGGHGIARKDLMNAMYLGDTFNLTMSYHTFSFYVNPKLFNKHPEYFTMNQQGKRVKPKSFYAQGSLCLSNPEVWRVTLDSLRKYIKRDRAQRPKDKWPVVYDISTLDNTPYICYCPKCSKITKAEGGDAGLVLHFINHIATEIAKEYPEIKIRTFAYSSAKDVPKITRPVSNVLIQYCDEFPKSDCYRPLTAKFNKKMLKNLEKWHKAGAKLALWDYWNMGGRFFNPPRIETVTDAIQPDMKTFRRLGIESLFLEAEKDQVTPQNFIDLNYFLAAQLMINPDKDQEALINTFITNYYGPASPEIAKYLQTIRLGVKNHPMRQRTMRVGRWTFITPQFMLDSYKMLKQAEAKTPPKSIYRKRVHYEMIPLLWQILVSQVENKENFKKSGISLKTLEKECKNYCLEYIKRNNPAKPDRYLKQFKKKFAALTAKIPTPQRFKKYSEGDIRVYGYPQFRPMPHVYGNVVNDPDSPTGKALMSSHPSPAYHGEGKIVRGKTWAFPAAKFEVGCLNIRRHKNIVISKIPQDEKYHWFKVPKAELSSKCLLWGHCWALQFDLSQAYQLANGIANNNIWNVWFSVKFTGPEWVKGSKKKNAVYLDRVVLVRPDAKPQRQN